MEVLIAEGDKVWVRFRLKGTTLNGEKIEAETISILRIVHGKAVEGWSVHKIGGDLRKQLQGN